MAEEAKSCNFELPLPSRETFKAADADMKSMYLFDLLCIALENQDKVRQRLELNQKKEKRFLLGLGTGSGAVGAIVIGLLKLAIGIHN